MSCELFDNDLKVMGFSSEPRCIYEKHCIFAGSRNINKSEASEECQALKDSKIDNTTTIEDIEQEAALHDLICIRHIN